MSALQPDDAPMQPDDAPVWREDERVVRTLALNQQKDLADCLDLVAKIVENIAASPEEHKYRSLRAASKALSTRILARPGGRAFAAVGDAIPDVSLDVEFPPKEVSLKQRLAGRKVILVGLPGAFTPT